MSVLIKIWVNLESWLVTQIGSRFETGFLVTGILDWLDLDLRSIIGPDRNFYQSAELAFNLTCLVTKINII